MKAKYFIEPNEAGIFCRDDMIARVDSRAVAEAFGESHGKVMEMIENLDCSVYFRNVNFELSEYVGVDRKPHLRYDMTREGFTYLVNSYIKEEYARARKELFNRFNEMEALVNDMLAEKYS